MAGGISTGRVNDGQRTSIDYRDAGASVEDLDLKLLRISTASDSPLQSKQHSTYHIYHKRQEHQLISTAPDPSKERWRGPTIKEQKEKRKRRKLREAEKNEGLTPIATLPEPSDGSFYLHTPYLAFHAPPRVLYTGSTKHTRPAILIHDTLFWRKWKLQLGPSLATPGVLDPRGVVTWRHNGGDRTALNADPATLKGYKVRTWRLWGETGKDFVHRVKSARKSGAGTDPDVVVDERRARESAVRADEVVWLKWTSPFTTNTRRYSFQYGGIKFLWKGTGTVRETRACGFFVHFNHLKLVARVPATSQDKTAGEVEICLGKYTCSVAKRKSGTLDLFDGAIWRLVEEYMPFDLPSKSAHGEGDGEANVSDGDAGTDVDDIAAVKKTRLYQVIIATAMCMIIGEKQKRATIRAIIEAAAGEGSAGA